MNTPAVREKGSRQGKKEAADMCAKMLNMNNLKSFWHCSVFVMATDVYSETFHDVVK